MKQQVEVTAKITLDADVKHDKEYIKLRIEQHLQFIVAEFCPGLPIVEDIVSVEVLEVKEEAEIYGNK